MKNQMIHKISLMIALLLLIAWIPLVYTGKNKNYEYVESFHTVFMKMKEKYVLGEYREIDWDRLYEKYFVQFQKAQEGKNAYQMYKLWRQFALEFQDGHVNVSVLVGDEVKWEQEYKREFAGSDYGFSIVTQSDGTNVFVDVDEKLPVYEMGIRNGMKILSIDEEPIDVLMKNTPIWFVQFPDAENADFYRGLAVMSKLSGDISVCYVDEKNQEHTVILQEQESYAPRFEQTYKKLNSDNENENLIYKMLDEDTAYLSLTEMQINENVCREDTVEKVKKNGSYEELHAYMLSVLEKLKKEGARNLVIDLRGNGGGFSGVSMAVASCFLNEEVCFKEGIYEVGKDEYGVYEEIVCPVDNQWGTGEVVILVNNNTASAAEIFLYFMKHQENVKVMGMTNSCGAAMAVDWVETDIVSMSYSGKMTLDEKNEILIDPGIDHKSKIPVDIRIPLDEEAIQNIFVEEKDYVLQYALDYLNGVVD